MKKMTKWLALALAGGLLSASLLSCTRQITWENEDEDEEDEEQSSVSDYVGLSPDGLREWLLLADNFTVEASAQFTSETREESAALTLKKYGDVLLHRVEGRYSVGSSLAVKYYDLKTMRRCSSKDGAQWQYSQVEDTREELLETLLLDDDGANLYFLLNAEAFEEGGSAESGYVMTQEAMAAWLQGPEGTVYEGKLTSRGSVYTFELRAVSPSPKGEYKYTYTIRFTCEPLEFPQEAGKTE